MNISQLLQLGFNTSSPCTSFVEVRSLKYDLVCVVRYGKQSNILHGEFKLPTAPERTKL